MTISYNKLWKLLIDKGMNKTQLGLAAKVSTSTISKLSKNETISMESMMKICRVLKCDIGDIVEMTDGKENKPDDGGQSNDLTQIPSAVPAGTAEP
jgi:DNA (cytosine-5)-methyltransferase 1